MNKSEAQWDLLNSAIEADLEWRELSAYTKKFTAYCFRLCAVSYIFTFIMAISCVITICAALANMHVCYAIGLTGLSLFVWALDQLIAGELKRLIPVASKLSELNDTAHNKCEYFSKGVVNSFTIEELRELSYDDSIIKADRYDEIVPFISEVVALA